MEVFLRTTYVMADRAVGGYGGLFSGISKGEGEKRDREAGGTAAGAFGRRREGLRDARTNLVLGTASPALPSRVEAVGSTRMAPFLPEEAQNEKKRPVFGRFS